jgi:hypothetical protein
MARKRIMTQKLIIAEQNGFPGVKTWWKHLVFYSIKLPLIFITIPVGFLFDFLVTFPYSILCIIDARMQNKD